MTSLIRTSLLLACLTALAVAVENDLAALSTAGSPMPTSLTASVRNELNRRINAIWVNRPASTVCRGCLVDRWFTNTGSWVARTFSVSNIDASLSGLPASLVKKVKGIVFANKMVFELVRHTITAPTATGHYLQYVGIARRSGTNVDFALVRGEVVGRLVQKYRTMHYRTCGRILWWQCCCRNHYYNVARGYSSAEILRIETALRAETVQRLRENANRINF